MRFNIESLRTMYKVLGSTLTSQKRKVFDRVVVVALRRQRQVMSVKNRQNKQTKSFNYTTITNGSRLSLKQNCRLEKVKR